MPAHANDFNDFRLGLILITWRRLVGGGLTDAGIPIDAQSARECNAEIPDEVLEHLRMRRKHSADPPRYSSAPSSPPTPGNCANSTNRGALPISSQTPNSRLLTLISDNEQHHSVYVIYDLGTKDNWMSAKTVGAMRFMAKMEDSDSKPLVDFNGKQLKSIGVVQAKWLRGGRLEDVKFRITENGPFQALFGYNFLFDKGLVTINDDDPSGGLILVEDEAISKDERKRIEEKRLRLKQENEKLRKDRDNMRSEGEASRGDGRGGDGHGEGRGGDGHGEGRGGDGSSPTKTPAPHK